MDADKARALVGRLRATLARHLGVDTEVSTFGQLDASERRARGELIPLADHLRAMVLTLLGSRRGWRHIGRCLGQLDLVFGGFKPAWLERVAPQQLADQVELLRCGNPRLRRQMESIPPNLETMQRIEEKFGCMDRFVELGSPAAVARRLGLSSSPYKLQELGPPLVLEYLKAVGIRTPRPAAHVRRIAGPARLALLHGRESGVFIMRKLRRFAEVAGVHPVALENMLRLLAARDYGAICGPEPRCALCELRVDCSFPLARELVQQSRRKGRLVRSP
jgi:hypothetical protein